jgi:hypothetical protein
VRAFNIAILAEKNSSPQEEPRLQVSRVFLDETTCSMHETVQDCPPDLVFNLDEVGISDWADRKSKKLVVRITAAGSTIRHRPSRNVKHLSVVTCTSASTLSDAIYGYISGFCRFSPVPGGNRGGNCEGFDLETPWHTRSQR